MAHSVTDMIKLCQRSILHIQYVLLKVPLKSSCCKKASVYLFSFLLDKIYVQV